MFQLKFILVNYHLYPPTSKSLDSYLSIDFCSNENDSTFIVKCFEGLVEDEIETSGPASQSRQHKIKGFTYGDQGKAETNV